MVAKKKQTNLILHKGGQRISEKNLGKIKPPPPEGRWHPIPHKLLLDTTKDQLKAGGFKIEHQDLAVSNEGKLFFATLDVSSKKYKPNGIGYAIGLRGSMNKTLSQSLAAGTHVFVCDNMAMHGEYVLRTKATKHILDRLPNMVAKGISKIQGMWNNTLDDIKYWKTCEVSEDVAAWFILEAVKRKIVPSSRAGFVHRSWENPEHKEFKPRNVWSLFNAFTDDMKEANERNPIGWNNRTLRLHGMFNEFYGWEDESGELLTAADLEV